MKNSIKFYTDEIGYIDFNLSKESLVQKLKREHCGKVEVSKNQVKVVNEQEENILYVVFNKQNDKILAIDFCDTELKKIDINNKEIEFDDFKNENTHNVKQSTYCGLKRNYVDTSKINCTSGKCSEHCRYFNNRQYILEDTTTGLTFNFDEVDNSMIVVEVTKELPINYKELEKETYKRC